VLNEDHFVFDTVEGEFTNKVGFNDVVYWSYDDKPHYKLERMQITLPSDSSHRPDILAKKQKNDELAQFEKDRITEIESCDAELRTKNKNIKLS